MSSFPCRRTLVIIVNQFPCVSETFISNEIRLLEERGNDVVIVSCARPTGDVANPSISARVVHLSGHSLASALGTLIGCLIRDPVSVIRSLISAYSCVPAGIRGVWRASHAVADAFQCLEQLDFRIVGHIHAHFLHRPALIATLLSDLTLVRHSMSGHARDVFAPDFHLRRLCRRAAFVTACSQHARAHLGRLFDASLDGRTFCCHHGVDLGVFDPLPRNAGVLVQPVRLLSVCRLVDKKGVDVILNALYLLKQRGGRFICTIVGDGPQKASLRRLNQRLGLSEVHFAGTLDHGAVRALYAEADLFVLGCRTAADGDRDGIPNVILEAMASGVPIIASSAGAVAEVVRHRDTGFLIPPDDPFMMADAIEELSDDINLRVAIVRNARVEVERRFDLRVNAASLISHLEYALRQPCRDFESCT